MINLDMSIDDALTAQPRLAGLFVRHRMICVGCGIARFHTLREAAELYEIDPDEFNREVERILAGHPTPGPDTGTSSGSDTPAPSSA